MNRDQAKAILPIIRAFADGKTVQSSQNNKYFGDNESPEFDGCHFWRIKPKPFEVWANIYADNYGGEYSRGLSGTKKLSENRSGDDCLRTVLLREVKE